MNFRRIWSYRRKGAGDLWYYWPIEIPVISYECWKWIFSYTVSPPLFFKLWDTLQIMFLFQWLRFYYSACYSIDFTWDKVTFIPLTGTEVQTFREYKTWVYPAIMWMNCQFVYAGVTQWHAGETDVPLDPAFKKLKKYVSTLLWFILLSEKQYCLFVSASIVLIQLRRKTFILNHLM